MAQKAHEEKNLEHVQKEEIPELEALKEWWRKHGDKVTYALLAVVALIFGYQKLGDWRAKTNAESFMEFSSANSPESIEQFIEKEMSSALAAHARLRLGIAYYSEEKYANAKEVYEAFLKHNPRHPLAGIAMVGVAACAEAMGDVAEAAGLFKAFVDAHPGSWLAPQARIGLGRSLILSGRKDEGQKVLDLFIAENAGTEWAKFADEVLRNRNRLTIPKTEQFDISAFFDATPDPEFVSPVEPAPEPAPEPAQEPAQESEIVIVDDVVPGEPAE